MLVLSRHRDESIIIGDDTVITVVDIRGDKVRLGVAAPIEISVHRQEVYEAIQREKRERRSASPIEHRPLFRRADRVIRDGSDPLASAVERLISLASAASEGELVRIRETLWALLARLEGDAA